MKSNVFVRNMYKPDPVKLYVLTQIAFTKLLVYSKLPNLV